MRPSEQQLHNVTLLENGCRKPGTETPAPVELDVLRIKSCKSYPCTRNADPPLLMQPAPSHDVSSMNQGGYPPKRHKLSHLAQYPRVAGKM
jgi:hypothetical protein